MALEKVCGIKIKGTIFEEEADLICFREEQIKGLGLLYGKNGAGKTTISKGFSALTGRVEEAVESVDLIDKDKNIISLTESEKKSIFVFNEDYINEKVKLNDDATGLGTIVVIGERAELQNKIDKAEIAYTKANAEFELQQENIKKYYDNKNEASPQYWKNEMSSKLKSGWAKRDSFIKQTRIASSVTAETYTRFIDLDPQESEAQLWERWGQKKIEFEEAMSGKNQITTTVNCDFEICADENEYRNLLNLKIESPILSEREKYLLALQKDRGLSHIETIKGIIAQPGLSNCPYCLQELSDDYRNELSESIEKILSKKVEEHISSLEALKLNEIQFAYSDLLGVPELCVQVELVQTTIQEINLKINEWNENLDRKINNVYSPILVGEMGLSTLHERYTNSLQELANAIVEYNQSITDVKPIKDELEIINNDLAHLEIVSIYNKFQDSNSAMKADEEELGTRASVLEKAKSEYDELLQKKRNTKIAKNEINDGLKYIFYSEDRLSIELQGDEYILKSRGKNVIPSHVSVGERNAIALCYYFSSIMSEKKEEEIYKNQYLLVIDDPVSSFDKDNRIGILSYLRREIGKFYDGNNKTKILIMSHDLQTTYDIEKIYKEVMGGGTGDANAKQYYLCELRNKDTTPLNLKNRSEYSILMNEVFKYACGNNQEFEYSIGNAMRRILEAYGTFNYKSGISQLSTNPEIAGRLNGHSEHFECLMYRLVLHGESHEEDRANILEIDDYFADLSSEEKLRTAQEVLCFLYLLDSYHVKVHINTVSGLDCGPIIEGWIRAISQPETNNI